MPSLANVFSPSGSLFDRLPGFTYREAQEQMAELISEAIETGTHAALEAGTGIGKTYAYLIPVLLSGQRAIISTGTKTLQDQLFTRDLPSLGGILGRPVTVALLKGRNNYLCWYRLETARSDGRQAASMRGSLTALHDWGRTSSSGDLTELDDLEEDHAMRAVVTSTVDNCLGSECEFVDRCFVLEARRRAQAAKIVIVNHHLLLADLALKESGFGDLLPGADVVIVDEAHQLPDVAQQFFGISITSRALEALLRDTTAEGLSAHIGDALQEPLGLLSRLLIAVRKAIPDGPARIVWHAAPRGLIDGLSEIRAALSGLAEVLEQAPESSSGLTRCLDRCREAAHTLATIAAPSPVGGPSRPESFDSRLKAAPTQDADPTDLPAGLRWLELSPRYFGAHWTPIDVGSVLSQHIGDQGGTWVFTSATLALGDDFTHFLTRVGIDDAMTAALPSPFDYRNNARLYLPQGLPEPRDPDFIDSLMSTVWPLLEATGGGAFLLFTSYRALHQAQDWLSRRQAPGPVLVQGSGSRSELLRQFRAQGNAILLGTGSFWQGVDVRGPALRMVVIDKLPFAAPGDPLLQARIEAIRQDGGDPFTGFQLPEAALVLKQGAGRLIRDFDDRGLIVLGDPRIRTRPYGRVFVQSLPPMPVLDELEDAMEFAATLKGVSEI